MDIDRLYKNCFLFQRMAQKIILDPSKKNLEFWTNFLYNSLGSIAAFLPSPQIAKSVFNAVAKNHASPAYASDNEIKEINTLLTALEEAENKLKQAGVDPISALKNKGMSNLNPNILNVLKQNLKTLQDGKDFSKYQHYYLPRHGEIHPKETIELDELPGDKNNPGY